MIWSYAKSDQAKWYRELLIHVDARPWYLTHHLLGRVKAGWPRADDCNCRTSSFADIARLCCMTQTSSGTQKGAEHAFGRERKGFFTNIRAQASIDQHGHSGRTFAILLLSHRRMYFSTAQSRLETSETGALERLSIRKYRCSRRF